MHNAWTKEESTCCSTSSFSATKSGIVLLFLQYASWNESLLGGGPFIVLQSRGISQIYHTYEEDMHPVYPTLMIIKSIVINSAYP